VELDAAASVAVTVRAPVAVAARRTADDVLGLVATDQSDSTTVARASARTTIVPRVAGLGDYATMPAVVAVRSTGASGVSPFVVGGSGRMADGRTAVDFFLQGPTDQRSQWGFGERDEYRATVRRDAYTLRLGDQVYGTSELTTTGIMGSGAEVSRHDGDGTFGAFAQQYRWTAGSPIEAGAWFSRGDSSVRTFGTALTRSSHGRTVGVGAAGVAVRAPFGARAELELSASDSADASGVAWRARVSGDTAGVRYDASLLRGSDGFAGPARGTLAGAVSVGRALRGYWDLSATVTRRTWSYAVSSLGRMGQAYSTATLAATWKGATAIEYGYLARRDEGGLAPVDGAQHGVRVSSVRSLGTVTASGSIEHGAARSQPGERAAAYTLVTAALRAGVGRWGTIGVSGSRSFGRTLTGANGDVLATGVNASLHLPGAFEAGVTMTAQRATFGMLDSSGAWFSVMDARVDRRLAGGATIGVHARVLQNPSAFGAGDASAVYLEYRAPFRLPTGRSRETGRAVGRVTDADRGAPVAGVLVRVGDQAAVSDRNGYVRFAGLDDQVHRVSVDPSGVTAGAILVGDVNVAVAADAPAPTPFAVAVTRGAQVAAYVVRDDGDAIVEPPGAAGGPSGGAERKVSPMGGVLVALEGIRDTIFQVTDARGTAAFGTVAPGRWVLSVRTRPTEAFTRFERERVEIIVAAGDHREVQFTLLPVDRQVKMMEGGGALKARTLPSPTPKPGAKP
jgi:hypothetical protein